jgi:hypothetical protein
VSKGGVADGKGYFGVILAVDTTVITQVSRGVARGNPLTMDSFRAEAYGLLAGISLLYLLTPTTPTTTANAANHIHTDSASLLARLDRAMSDFIPGGFWLKPESDVVRQTIAESQPIHNLARHYVKGHQYIVTKKRQDYTQAGNSTISKQITWPRSCATKGPTPFTQ